MIEDPARISASGPFLAIVAHFACKGLSIPDLSMNHALLAETTWSMPTHGTFRIEAGIQMDEEVRLATEVPVEDSLEFFHLPMALL
jgi:hypothetical protein